MAALALGLAGCGDDDPPRATAPATDLTVSSYDGDDLVEVRTLDCTPASAECTRVVELLPSLEGRPDEACTQVYGGPERFVVEGRVEGEPVSIEVTRANGCQIERYDRLQQALGG